jgi:hypothetical protein
MSCTDSGLEEGAEGQHLVAGQEDVLAGGGAADGALVQVQRLGHLGAREWDGVARPVAQKVGLAGHDVGRHAAHGVAALADVVDELAGPLYLGSHMLLVAGRESGAGIGLATGVQGLCQLAIERADGQRIAP